MRLQLSTWPEVEAYLARSTGIIIPIGSTEQHGPTGFIGTDALCPELLALGLAEQKDVMVGPTLSIGMAQHHLGFPGSVTLRPLTLIAVVQDVVASLAKHGFDRFFFLNGHGGNIATVTAAFSEIYAEHSLGKAPSSKHGDNKPPVRCTLVNWFELDGVTRISKELFGADDGSHATCGEVSLTYYGYQKDAARVRGAAMTPGRAGEGPIYDCDDYRRRFPDGRIGSDPRKATVEAGEKLYHSAVEEIGRRFDAFVTAD